MLTRPILTAGLATVIAGFTAIPSTNAATQSRTAQHQTADMCQLSIPTTDTKIRPKATGFRNEGTSNAFVICGFPSAEGGSLKATTYYFFLHTMDGQSHDVSCTAVNASWPGSGDAVYLTKMVSVYLSAESGGNLLQFIPSDFGLGGATFMSSFSMTCNLPPNVAIGTAYTVSTTDIGN